MKPNRSFVLCATDFSSGANDAAGVAARLAHQRSENLRLIHATDTTSTRVLAQINRQLEVEAQRLRESGATVEPMMLEGARPSEVLLGFIRAERPSLVVVSSGVKGPLDRWALGSFSERIAESSPVPTLVVRNPAVFESLDWSHDRLTVLLAIDLHPTSDVVLRWAKEFRRSTPCDFVCSYVNLRRPTAEEAAVPPGRPVNPAELQRRLERELQKKVRDQMGDDDSIVVVQPYFGEPAPFIVEIASQKKAHLIAVGAHQRRGLSRLTQFSVSRELLHQAGTNIVCVPVTTEFDPREAHVPDFRRVLVATDFSELGNAAIPFACAACSIGGQVKIVHVAMKSRRPRSAADLTQQLRSLVPNEMGARGQPLEVEVLEDRDVASALCAEAERFGADLVCLASHGLGASRALHGSVTKDVLKKIRRPLLIIRRPDE